MTQSATIAPDMGWLRSKDFDLTFIRGCAILAIGCGLLTVAYPELLPIIFLTNLWLLGYHHVISTFTRLAFDRESIRQHKFLLFGLPPLVFATTFLVANTVGVWLIASIYIYWQWFHYTRQSWGIHKAYSKKAQHQSVDPRLAWATFYLIPLYGILYRSWQAPDLFFAQALVLIPVPGLIVDLIGVAALLAFCGWGYQMLRGWMAGQQIKADTYYMVSHLTIFLVGYRLIEDITHGWLVLNIWHNAQYILFVWLFNNKRFSDGVDPQAKLISWISQSRNIPIYFGFCILISSLLYGFITWATNPEDVIAAVPLIMLVYQTLNFHHYIVDSVIWKMRKAPMQKTLGLSNA